MTLLSLSETGAFQMLVQERQAVLEQILERQCQQANELDLEALLSELVYINEAPIQTGAGRRRARKQLRHGLGQLLDRCDRASVEDPETALSHAADYLVYGRISRARRLLEGALLRFESRNDLRLALARTLMKAGLFQLALTHLELLCDDQADDQALRLEAAEAASRCLRFDKAVTHQEHYLRLAPVNLEAALQLNVLRELQQAKHQASQPGVIPTLSVDVGLAPFDQATELRLALAEQLYRQYGALILNDVFDRSLINRCHQQFQAEHLPLLESEQSAEQARSGTRRVRFSLATSGEFNSPDFYANDFVMRLVKRLLGPDLIIGSQMALAVLPGAREQQGSIYHRALFTQGSKHDERLPTTPPVAIRCLIPLHDLNPRAGTMAVKKGSHQLSSRAARELDFQVSDLPAGSCALVDVASNCRVQGNQTEEMRTLVDLIYQRTWFVDRENFRNLAPLNISAEEYQCVPNRHRKLFDWAMQPRASVGHKARTN